jgi:AcrR family transcriptional regulator
MSEAHHRKKNPDEVRRRLIAAAESLAVELGVEAITMEAVAHRAEVSKGGLQHHFRSRQALLDALFAELWSRFQCRIESCIESDPEILGRSARAYLHATDELSVEGADDEAWRALMIAMLRDANVRKRWSLQVRESTSLDDAADLDEAARLLICRLAADGLWLADLLGHYDVPDELRTEVVRRLDALTRGSTNT